MPAFGLKVVRRLKHVTFLGSPRGASPWLAPDTWFMRLVLKFVAFGSCWPLGQSEYRTDVSGS